MLYALVSARPVRRAMLRHQRKMVHLDKRLALAAMQARVNHLAVEVIAACRLIKGYSAPNAPGLSTFDRVIGIAAVPPQRRRRLAAPR